MSFTPAVDLGDTAIEFGYFDLSTLGLNNLFSSYMVGYSDAGNGIAIIQSNNYRLF